MVDLWAVRDRTSLYISHLLFSANLLNESNSGLIQHLLVGIRFAHYFCQNRIRMQVHIPARPSHGFLFPFRGGEKMLPEPEVIACYFDESFTPHLAAMRLRWPVETTKESRWLWELPLGIRFSGPLPEQLGISIQRWASDSFVVCLLWDKLCLRWSCVPANQLLFSSLPVIFAALKTDLHYLLDQPVCVETRTLTRVA